MGRIAQLVLWVSLVVISIPITAFGQGGTAALVGTVSDESKAVLPGATVTATEVNTGRVYSAVTDARGEYRMPNVAPGNYKAQAELSGFGIAVYPSVDVLVGQNAALSFTLKLASVEETVTVSGQSPLVDTRSAAVAGNVDRQQMESMPLAGRNFLELSMLVKGITANDVGTTPGVKNQDQFNLNVDGQQVSQRIGSMAFGQVRFSRESIAEFQIVTNQYDITQGRSTGMQVQAITKAGTNRMSGSAYTYLRDDKFNAADHVAKRVLPYENQQFGGSLGGPIQRDKLHFFATFEYEREPFTALSSPPLLIGQNFAFESKSTTQIYLLRGDYQVSDNNHLSVRQGRHFYLNPFFVQSGTEHPSRVTYNPINSNNIQGTWTRVHSNATVSELRLGFSGFFFLFGNLPEIECPSQQLSIDDFKTKSPRYTCAPFVGPPNYSFPGGLQIGSRPNQLNDFNQHNYSIRYDVNVNRGNHDLKLGGEFRRVWDEGFWHNIERGQFNFHTLPPTAELNRRFPADAWNDPSRWDVAGLEPYVLNFQQTFDPTGFRNDVPRPEYSVWFGDTWRTNGRLTLNYGLRYDLDWGGNSPKGIVDRDILINNGKENGNFGFKSDIRDLLDISPRGGFSYVADEARTLVIRGGSGLYYSTPDSGSVYSFQLSNQEIAGEWNYAGQPNFMTDPRGGVTTEQMYGCLESPATCAVKLPPQPAQIRAANFRNPVTWQNTAGIQKQVSPTLGFDSELIHWIWYRDRRSYDPNLFFDPATGYNRNPLLGRPNADWGNVNFSDSTGRRDYLASSNSLTRRMQKNFQAGLTYTAMFYYRDDISAPNNPFDRDAEWARSTEFQRHTLRAYAIFQMPWRTSFSPAYFYGSGNYYPTTHASTPYGKPGTNRLNLGAPVTIPEAIRDQFEGPSVIGTGQVVPRNALKGLPLHRVDLRLTHDLVLGSAKVSLIGEVFNLFNHANYGDFVGTVNSLNFGQPRQNFNNAYAPRSAQLAVHMRF